MINRGRYTKPLGLAILAESFRRTEHVQDIQTILLKIVGPSTSTGQRQVYRLLNSADCHLPLDKKMVSLHSSMQLLLYATPHTPTPSKLLYLTSLFAPIENPLESHALATNEQRSPPRFYQATKLGVA